MLGPQSEVPTFIKVGEIPKVDRHQSDENLTSRVQWPPLAMLNSLGEVAYRNHRSACRYVINLGMLV